MRARLSPRSRSKAFRGSRDTPAKAQADRGRTPYNIWYVFSPKNRCDLILRSDGQLDHFYWLEGDAGVKTYELPPQPIACASDGKVVDIRFDALVVPQSGRPLLRDIASDIARNKSHSHEQIDRAAIAKQAGFDYSLVGANVLQENHQLICNWRRAVAYLAAAREISLDVYRNEMVAAVVREQHAPLGRLLAGTAKMDGPLFIAAVLDRIQAGVFASDLHLKPLSLLTQVSFAGGAR